MGCGVSKQQQQLPAQARQPHRFVVVSSRAPEGAPPSTHVSPALTAVNPPDEHTAPPSGPAVLATLPEPQSTNEAANPAPHFILDEVEPAPPADTRHWEHSSIPFTTSVSTNTRSSTNPSSLMLDETLLNSPMNLQVPRTNSATSWQYGQRRSPGDSRPTSIMRPPSVGGKSSSTPSSPDRGGRMSSLHRHGAFRSMRMGSRRGSGTSAAESVFDSRKNSSTMRMHRAGSSPMPMKQPQQLPALQLQLAVDFSDIPFVQSPESVTSRRLSSDESIIDSASVSLLVDRQLSLVCGFDSASDCTMDTPSSPVFIG